MTLMCWQLVWKMHQANVVCVTALSDPLESTKSCMFPSLLSFFLHLSLYRITESVYFLIVFCTHNTNRQTAVWLSCEEWNRFFLFTHPFFCNNIHVRNFVPTMTAHKFTQWATLDGWRGQRAVQGRAGHRIQVCGCGRIQTDPLLPWRSIKAAQRQLWDKAES